ncbi:MAG: hypothetical protein COY58_07795 [Gammaproteobacteria bacterium CG_4_10_14_0_8_um_filter_38_16]|nr:MAG: hypothetical protein COY58_07795 [Gammaproteobacteria bacterium CG_4_10_14_0_8_um_filter_38_16]
MAKKDQKSKNENRFAPLAGKTSMRDTERLLHPEKKQKHPPKKREGVGHSASAEQAFFGSKTKIDRADQERYNLNTLERYITGGTLKVDDVKGLSEQQRYNLNTLERYITAGTLKVDDVKGLSEQQRYNLNTLERYITGGTLKVDDVKGLSEQQRFEYSRASSAPKL